LSKLKPGDILFVQSKELIRIVEVGPEYTRYEWLTGVLKDAASNPFSNSTALLETFPVATELIKALC
jgi:hypothetical protein